MDIGKISNIARMADAFISLNKAENNLDENAVDEYIQKAINGICMQPLCIGQIRDSVKCPVQNTVAIDQY